MVAIMDQFCKICMQLGLPCPEKEYRFHPERKWRIDYSWPHKMLAIELEGGVYTQGRHVRPKGFMGDLAKYNALSEMGWVLLRYQPTKIDYDQIIRTYENRSNEI